MAGKKKDTEGRSGQLVDESGEVLLDAGEGAGEALPAAPEGEPTEREAEGWDAEGEHATATERLESSADDLDLDSSEMVFDVRDFLLELFKNRPKPWSGCSQGEQRDIAAACEHASKELVRKVAEAIATKGVDSIRVLLTKVTMAGDIVITGKVKTFDDAEEDRAVLQLHRAIGKHVMVTRASADDYAGEGRDPETEPDEPDFGFEGGEPDEDEDEDLAE